MYKRTYVAELNRISPRDRLPTDRLEKMKVAARAMKEKPTGAAPKKVEDESDDDEHLERGADFGMAFKEGSGQQARHVCWIGRVEKLFKSAGKSGRSKVRVDSLKVDEVLGKGCSVLASWYVAIEGRRGRYKYNAVADATVYSLDHLIGLVSLEYDAASDAYVLEPLADQLASLAAGTQRTEPAKPGKPGGRTRGEVDKADERRREQQNARHLQAPIEGADRRQQRDQRAVERHGAPVLQDPKRMSVFDLKEELGRLNLSTAGLRSDLAARVAQARQAAEGPCVEAEVGASPAVAVQPEVEMEAGAEAAAMETEGVHEPEPEPEPEAEMQVETKAEVAGGGPSAEVHVGQEAQGSEPEAEAMGAAATQVSMEAAAKAIDPLCPTIPAFVDRPPPEPAADDLRDLSGGHIQHLQGEGGRTRSRVRVGITSCPCLQLMAPAMR